LPRVGVAKQVVISGAVVGCVAIAIAKIPPWLVERGDKAMSACLAAAAEAHGDPASCRVGPGFELGAAFPHVRIHARELREALAYRRLALAAHHALATGAGLHEAVTAFLDHARGLASEQQIRRSYEEMIEMLVEGGAYAELAALDTGDLVLSSSDVPARAALVIGDVALARERIRSASIRGSTNGTSAGALACVLGDRARALALLARTDREVVSAGGDAMDLARLAGLHCGGTLATLGVEPTAVSVVYRLTSLLALAFDPAFQAGRRSTFAMEAVRETSIFPIDYVGATALAASSSDIPPLDLLALADRFWSEVPDPAAITPWQVLRPDDNAEMPQYVPPAWLEAAAPRFEHAAEAVPAKLDRERDDLHLTDDASSAPRMMLRNTAARMYRYAAISWLRRGDHSHVAELLAHDRALAPSAVERAPIELASGDPDAALATLDAWAAANPKADEGERTTPDLVRSLALIAKDDFAAAYDVASQLRESKEARWVALAAALASGKPAHVGAVSPHQVMTPAAWQQAIDAHALVKDQYLPVDAVRTLPLVMYIIGYAAKQAGRDPEHVLDEYFSSSFGGRSQCLARAQAARWRKDEQAARRWDRCAATIATLMQDDHAAVLASLGGLW
jgi:hypothetical protein